MVEPHPAVHDQVVAGDVGRGGRDQEEHGPGDLLAPPEAFEGDRLEHGPLRGGVAHQAADALRVVDGAGGDGVDPNVVGRPLHGQGARQVQNARLGRPGVGHVRRGEPGVVRPDVDDAPAALRPHRREDCPAHEERPVEHDLDDRPPAVRGELLRRAQEVTGGVVDEDVDAPEALERPLRDPLGLLGVAHVGLEGEGAPPQRLDLPDDLGVVLGVAAGDHDVGAVAGQLPRDDEADARPPARHDRDPALQEALAKDHATPPRC